MKLADRVAIVTGAAQGIGAACARAFAEAGARVVVADVNEVGGSAVVKSIAAAGGYALYKQADVGTTGPTCEALVDYAVTHFGRVDVLVNNAGIVHAAEFLDLAEEDFDRVLRVNLKGAFLCAQAAARQMAKQAPRSQWRARRHHQHVERQRGARDREPGAVHGEQGRRQPADEGDGARARAARHPRGGDRPGSIADRDAEDRRDDERGGARPHPVAHAPEAARRAGGNRADRRLPRERRCLVRDGNDVYADGGRLGLNYTV